MFDCQRAVAEILLRRNKSNHLKLAKSDFDSFEGEMSNAFLTEFFCSLFKKNVKFGDDLIN